MSAEFDWLHVPQILPYPFARLSEANKTIITDGVKRTGPIGGICRVIHIVGSV